MRTVAQHATELADRVLASAQARTDLNTALDHRHSSLLALHQARDAVNVALHQYYSQPEDEDGDGEDGDDDGEDDDGEHDGEDDEGEDDGEDDDGDDDEGEDDAGGGLPPDPRLTDRIIISSSMTRQQESTVDPDVPGQNQQHTAQNKGQEAESGGDVEKTDMTNGAGTGKDGKDGKVGGTDTGETIGGTDGENSGGTDADVQSSQEREASAQPKHDT